jgi:hypothetical protein
MPGKQGLMDRIGNALQGVGRGVGAVGSGIGNMLAAGGNAYAPQDLNLNRNQQMGLLSNVVGDMTIGPRGQRQSNTPGYLSDIRANQTRSDLTNAINGMTDLTEQEKAIVLAMPAADQIAFVQEKLQAKYAPTGSNQAPSNVRTHQYYRGLNPDEELTPEQLQEQYLTVTRAAPWLNTGSNFQQPSLLDPGATNASVPIEYGPGDSPEDRATIAREVGDQEIITSEEIAENNARIAREESVVDRDIDRLDSFREDRNSYNQNLVDMDLVIAKATEILDHPGFDMAYGGTRYVNTVTGGLFNIGGGTDLTNLVSTFEDNIFAQMLAKMRNQSESGGAVGQVSEKEGERFTNMMGDLRRSTSEEQARSTFENIIREFRNTQRLYGLALEQEYPELAGSEGVMIEGYTADLGSGPLGSFNSIAGLPRNIIFKLENGEELSTAEMSNLSDSQVDEIVAVQEKIGGR